MLEVTDEDVLMMACAMEFECNDFVYQKVNDILYKIDGKLGGDHNQLYIHGVEMGWIKQEIS